MTDAGDGKCSAADDEDVSFIASIIVVSGIMAAILVLSGLFHSVLRRLGQPSVISHILVRA
jgi:Kef-type K+ transport system membrane component KefB